jgi:hypothetical protein
VSFILKFKCTWKTGYICSLLRPEFEPSIHRLQLILHRTLPPRYSCKWYVCHKKLCPYCWCWWQEAARYLNVAARMQLPQTASSPRVLVSWAVTPRRCVARQRLSGTHGLHLQRTLSSERTTSWNLQLQSWRCKQHVPAECSLYLQVPGLFRLTRPTSTFLPSWEPQPVVPGKVQASGRSNQSGAPPSDYKQTN